MHQHVQVNILKALLIISKLHQLIAIGLFPIATTVCFHTKTYN